MKDGASHMAECANARGGADQPFDEMTLYEKLQDNCAAIFPMMPDILRLILAGDPEIGKKPWRDAVAQMVGE
jgi:hypothetical protein